MRPILVFKRFNLFPLVMLGVFFGSTCIVAEQYYSNVNSELFRSIRYTGCGGAASVDVPDAEPQGNPASVASFNGSGIALSTWYAGFYANTFSVSGATVIKSVDSNSSIALSCNYFTVPGTAYYNFLTDDLGYPNYDPARIAPAPVNQGSLRLTYGRRIFENENYKIIVGGALNAQRINLLGYTGYGIGADAGAALRLKKTGFTGSLIGENITTNYFYWNSSYKDVAWPHLLAGVDWDFRAEYLYGVFRAGYRTVDILGNQGINYYTTDVKYSKLNSNSITDTVVSPQWAHANTIGDFLAAGNVGAEYEVLDRVTLRVGHSAFNPITLGGAVYLLQRRLGIEFAWLSHDLGGTYQMGLAIRL